MAARLDFNTLPTVKA